MQVLLSIFSKIQQPNHYEFSQENPQDNNQEKTTKQPDSGVPEE
jgi:hypothetical protein